MPECSDGPGHQVTITPHTAVPEGGPGGPIWSCLTCGRWGAVLVNGWAELFEGEPLAYPLGRTTPGEAPPIRRTYAYGR
ncbi:hypothetical protein [Kitasatospora cineracea]|uniref:Uncharacterized protein n=1 Tax=Kitasatospora cineracea TaxID=88074 RepID=A0A3N4RII1_9ACTN|nr:hypothetical protein [Kitasatospora cineracea]RPE33218.1 hypothetical protein EDD38_1497 [Kitasatospora cineracea]